jgi:hypothetical protein
MPLICCVSVSVTALQHGGNEDLMKIPKWRMND